MSRSENILELGINARFRLAHRYSGVQNWSSNVVNELSQIPGVLIREFKPNSFFASGLAGHFWEQFILPFLCRNTDVLFSPANSGPVLRKKQVVCVHDAMVFTHPNMFTVTYRLLSKFLLRMYELRKIGVVSVSENSMREIEKVVPDIKNLGVVGMGTTIFGARIPETNHRDYFLFVGGDIQRKNLTFILDFWESVHSKTGYELIVVTGAKSSTVMRVDHNQVPGVSYVVSPTTEHLSDLYYGMRALLWPSLAEGFGIPLLEAMSFGKPFISTPVGAAQELSIGDSMIISLDKNEWFERIVWLTEQEANYSELQVLKSKEYSWEIVTQNVKFNIEKFLISIP